MPRDSGGNYTLPAGNPVVSGTVIQSDWANPTMSDLAVEITDSLSRSGRGGMLVPFRLDEGTEGNPGIAFTIDPNTGMWLAGSGDLQFSAGGVSGLRVTENEVEVDRGSGFEPVLTESQNFESGTTMVFKQPAAPSGWTQIVTDDDSALRVVSGVGGGTGGTVDFTTAFMSQAVTGSTDSEPTAITVEVNNHTVSLSELTAHPHELEKKSENINSFSGATNIALGGLTQGTKVEKTKTVGGNAGHSHGSTVNDSGHSHTLAASNIDLEVKYVDVIVASKD